jgi:hypothetical protein
MKIPLVAALSLSLATAGLAGAATSLPRVESCAGKSLLRPAGGFVLSCADGNAAIDGTTWSSWGRNSAAGTTTFDVNPCTPSCVQSKMRVVHDATIELLDPVSTKQGARFSRAEVRYTLGGRHLTFIGYPRT